MTTRIIKIKCVDVMKAEAEPVCSYAIDVADYTARYVDIAATGRLIC